MADDGDTIIPALEPWARPGERLHDYYVVDVFTDTPLEGNQLGLFTDGRPFSSGQMQAIARELNFAETAFLLPAEGDGDVRMRIFTTARELPFAGHPVLGTAFVVGQALGRDRVALETLQGTVALTLERDGDRVAFGRMEQPIPTGEPFDREAELLAGLGVGASALPVAHYSNGTHHLYVGLPSEDDVVALSPDLAALKPFATTISCFAGSGTSWKVRMFAPGLGQAEDPATGSAAGPLAVHLARHGAIGWGEEIEIRQGFEIGRPSYLYARVEGSADRVDSVVVGGSAVVVSAGSYLVDGSS